MQVRVARPDDHERIDAIHSAAVEAHGLSSYDADQVRAWASGSVDPSVGHSLVAERDRIVGWGRLDNAEITALYVDPAHDRSGVGTAILAGLEGEARGRGEGELTAWSSANAVAFYERAGYAVVEHTRYEIDDCELPIVRLEKSL